MTARRLPVARALGVLVGVLALVGRVPPAQAAEGIITTAVGTGVSGFSGDGGPPTSAQIGAPYGLATRDGNLYLVDALGGNPGQIRIRFVNYGAAPVTVHGVTVAPGTIATVAGNGDIGNTGDGGPALQAAINASEGITLDAFGNLFFGSYENGVRKVDTAGTITKVVAGTNSDSEVTSGDGGPALAASVHVPLDVAFDAQGNLYVAELGKFDQFKRVRKVVPGSDGVINGGSDEIISTVAGKGTEGFSGDGGPAVLAELCFFSGEPSPIAIHPDGHLLIGDHGNNRVRLVNLGTLPVTAYGVTVAPGAIDTIAGSGSSGGPCSANTTPYSGGGGPATEAKFEGPDEMDVDAAGNIFIVTLNWRVLKVAPGPTLASTIITTVAGSGAGQYNGDGIPATQAGLEPNAVVLLGTDLFISDGNNRRVRRVEGAPPPAIPEVPAAAVLGALALALFGAAAWLRRRPAPVAAPVWGRPDRP